MLRIICLGDLFCTNDRYLKEDDNPSNGELVELKKLIDWEEGKDDASLAIILKYRRNTLSEIRARVDETRFKLREFWIEVASKMLHVDSKDRSQSLSLCKEFLTIPSPKEDMVRFKATLEKCARWIENKR